MSNVTYPKPSEIYTWRHANLNQVNGKITYRRVFLPAKYSYNVVLIHLETHIYNGDL